MGVQRVFLTAYGLCTVDWHRWRAALVQSHHECESSPTIPRAVHLIQRGTASI